MVNRCNICGIQKKIIFRCNECGRRVCLNCFAVSQGMCLDCCVDVFNMQYSEKIKSYEIDGEKCLKI
jgi:hypothetical protein